jgi:hypothetical protein
MFSLNYGVDLPVQRDHANYWVAGLTGLIIGRLKACPAGNGSMPYSLFSAAR